MDFAIERKGTLTLEVFEENEISRAFYQKYGFMEIEQYFDDETQRNQIRMTLN